MNHNTSPNDKAPRYGALIAIGFYSLIILLNCTTAVPLLAQLTAGHLEVAFMRDDTNFHEPVSIKVELVGAVFNEKGVYDTNVDPRHD